MCLEKAKENPLLRKTYENNQIFFQTIFNIISPSQIKSDAQRKVILRKSTIDKEPC